MSSYREFFGSKSKSSDSRRSNSDSTNVDETLSLRLDPGTKPREELKRVSSEVLATKKGVLARFSKPLEQPLKDLSGPLGGLARSLNRAPLDVGGTNLARTLVASPSVKLPNPVEQSHPNVDEAVPVEPLPSLSSTTPRQISSQSLRPTSTNPIRDSSSWAGPGKTPTESRSAGQSLDEPQRSDGIRSEISVSISHSLDRGGSDDHSALGSTPSRTEPITNSQDLSNRTESRASDSHSGKPLEGLAVTVGSRLPDPETMRSREDLRTTSIGRGSREPGHDNDGKQKPDSSSAKLSIVSVRNPLSSDLNNFSRAKQEASVGDINSQIGVSALGKMESMGGLSHSGLDGGTNDMTRTNELLQELINAVSKQRGSSLPVGGPSVYADR